MSGHDGLTSRLQKAMASPSEERNVWSSSLAGVLISAYLWVAFSDQLSATTLAVGGLPAAIGGAALGGLLSCVFLYLPSALQGLRTRMPLMVAATSAFGVQGSALVPGLLLGLVQILWFAVAVHYAVEFNLRGLLSAGLIAPEDIRTASDDWDIHRSTVYAASVLMWGIAAALVATRFIRWIAALMVVYPIFIAMALGGAMVWAMPGLPDYRDATANPELVPNRAVWPAFWEMTQLVFGFSATVAAQAVNWGATLRGRRDVLLSGVVGVGIASTIIASLAVLTVSGSIGKEIQAELTLEESVGFVSPLEEPEEVLADRAKLIPPATNTEAYTLGTVFERRIGGIPGAIALIVLGLGSLASAVYACYSYSNRLEAIRRRPRRWAWGIVGAIVAFPMMINGLAANVPLVIDLTAGVLAPMLGVLSADLIRHRSGWPGPSPGYRVSGLVGWGLGVGVGVLPIIARIVPGMGPCRWLPLAVLAFLASFLLVFLVEGIASIRSRSSRTSSSQGPTASV